MAHDCFNDLVPIMMKILVFSTALAASVSTVAEDDFALVDSVGSDPNGIITSLSLESEGIPGEGNPYKFNGTIWSNEYGNASRPVVVNIEAGLVDEVNVDEKGGRAEISSIEQSFTYSEHNYTVGEQTFVRSQYYSSNRNAYIFVSDDPGPFAIAAFLAGSVVAICAADRIANYFQCEGNSGGEISLKSGFTCTTECN